MHTWMLLLILAGQKEPAVIAKGYESEKACDAAGELLKKADMEARGKPLVYTVVCQEL